MLAEEPPNLKSEILPGERDDGGDAEQPRPDDGGVPRLGGLATIPFPGEVLKL